MADELLDELTSLPHAARYRRLIEIGRAARTKPAAILDRWERGDWQERLFCTQSCAGSGDTARLLRLTDDPSRSVSGQALKLLLNLGSDQELAELLIKATHGRRRSLIIRLRAKKRFAPIDAFLTIGFASGLPRVAGLLPYGSAEVVRQHLAAAEHLGGGVFWERLARCQPRIAVSAMLERLAAVAEPDGLLLYYARCVVRAVGGREPDLAVQLIQALAKFASLSTLQATDAIRRRPNELVAVALGADDPQTFSFNEVATRLERSALIKTLCERPAALTLDASWFSQLPAATRAAIWREVSRSERDAEGLVPVALLAALPTAERIAEAERIAALPIMTTRPATQATYAAYLPPEKMRAIVDRFLTHPEGESRGQGWAALITSLEFHRAQAAEVLALIRKRKFEQDPVRSVILQNLASLPPGLWKAAHRDDIAGIVREALDATDLSHASVMYLTAWIQRLIPSHLKWAAEQLVVIYRERGNIGGFELESRIDDRQALVLEAAFLEIGGDWSRGNRVGWLVWFAAALGKRLRVCQRLCKLLAELLADGAGLHAHSILQLLRQHLPRAEFERLAERLIAGHASWVAMSPIFDFLHRRRQDWLEPHLSTTTFKMQGGARVELLSLLPPNGYTRYTLAQQTRLAETLNGLIRLPAGDKLPKDVWTKLRAIEKLAKLPAADASRLIELSRDKRPVIAEAAVRALGRLDAGQGVPTLVEALGDDRARFAIYALRQALAALPPGEVLSRLQSAPLEKVTVAKEVIRLIGDFGGDAGCEWLLTTARRDLHRDVRIALFRGLWDHLERPEVWEILGAAAQSSDGQTLNGVIRIPADRLSADSRRKLIDLLTRLASHSDAIIRLAVLRRFVEMPLPDPDGRLVQAASASLSAVSPDERTAAAGALVANASAKDAARIARVVDVMLPQRRALHEFVQQLRMRATDAALRRRWRPAAEMMLATMKQDPLTAGLRLQLAASVLGAEAYERELKFLAESSFPISAVSEEALEAIGQINDVPHRSKLPSLEERLATADDAHLRLLALHVLIEQATDRESWSDERRARLERYRRDADPRVAVRAQFFFGADAE